MKRLRHAVSHRGSLAMALLIFGLGAGCAGDADDELSWGNCCALKITEEKSSSKERAVLIAWGGRIGFHGDGKSQDWEGTKAWRRQEIGSGLAHFEQVHPGSQARDYLTGLGMTCTTPTPTTPPATGPARCIVDLSVWATCIAKLGLFVPAPVPKPMRKPIAAVLQMTIDVSASDILDSSVRVVPLPGGRLCER